MKICGKDVAVLGHFPRIARIGGEGFEFFEDPEAALSALRATGGVDIFTFAQRLPNIEPQHQYPMEWDNVAALPVSTFDNWWNKQINGKTRNKARQVEKKGVTIAEAPFDDSFALGIWEIYNETPIRQGRRFPHFGKDLEAVRQMSATFLDQSIFIGAFFEGKMIGFAKLTIDDARSQAAVMHILAMISHRDKSITNALIAQSVRSCAERNIPYIVYSNFSYGNKKTDSLAEFKEHNGFQRINLPRYYVPMTAKGRIALRLGLHRSLIDYIPESVMSAIRDYRTRWYMRKFRMSSENTIPVGKHVSPNPETP